MSLTLAAYCSGVRGPRWMGSMDWSARKTLSPIKAARAATKPQHRQTLVSRMV